MNKIRFALMALCSLVGGASFAVELQLNADRLAVDRATESLIASGHVHAVSHPFKFTGEYCVKNADDVAHFYEPASFTTCTNEQCKLHWRIDGEAEYAKGRHVWMKNMVVRFWEVPVLWVPYWYYPLDRECGWRVMVGYTGRWGAYMLNKYVYHIAGDRTYAEGSWYLHGNTRFDLRWRNGAALGQTLYWQLGDFGRGKFKVYYAWDADHDRYANHWRDVYGWNYRNWGSEVPANRYGIELHHSWDITERDLMRLNGAIYSDSSFRHDFIRNSFFNIANNMQSYDNNELAWEHIENSIAVGASVSGVLNEFISGVSRLPEVYFDVAPLPVWTTPLVYESQNRVGYLNRRAARYGDASEITPYSFNPGEWADYSAFRFDTYHRFTLPFKIADVLSVVPRLAWRGTWYSETGRENISGRGTAGRNHEDAFRSVVEAGVTFAARGHAMLGETWQHVLEPYADVLAQEASWAGLSAGRRPYIFDSLDASTDWSDQFAGRGRNLPYSWYGVVPGVRNVFRRMNDRGHLRTVFDFDVYAALQCNSSDWTAGDSWHRLAAVGRPNYGENSIYIMPGFRMRWFPTTESALTANFEYDGDNDRIAVAELRFSQKLNRKFSWHVTTAQRNYRWWDFSSTPYDRTQMISEDFNRVHYWYAEIGFEHEICDAIAWSPYLRWDCREGELDGVGTWLDLRTDCLGFRFIVGYDNRYHRIDGSEYPDDWNIGFYIYLRAFGSGSGSLFGD